MRAKVLWVFVFCALILAGGAWAQTRLEPIGGEEEPAPEIPVGEDCGNGFDDDGNGTADCADPACANDPACGSEAPCPEVEIHEVEGAVVFKHTPGKICSNNVTDTDGKDFKTPGCMTYWNDNLCTAGPINHEWDSCNGNQLTEWYTGGVGKAGCGSRATVTRDCGVLIDCPNDAVAVCVTKVLNCGGLKNIGYCACPAQVAVNEAGEELPEEP